MSSPQRKSVLATAQSVAAQEQIQLLQRELQWQHAEQLGLQQTLLDSFEEKLRQL